MHLCSTPGLVDQVCPETAAFAKSSQQPQQFGFPEASRLQLTVEGGLSLSCPLLKACYYECLWLYLTPMAVSSIERNFVLSEIARDGPSGVGRHSFSMEAGKFTVVPLAVDFYNLRFFESPREFQPKRFLNSAADGERRHEFHGTPLMIDGNEFLFCPARFHLENEILVFVAGILALWDF